MRTHLAPVLLGLALFGGALAAPTPFAAPQRVVEPQDEDLRAELTELAARVELQEARIALLSTALEDIAKGTVDLGRVLDLSEEQGFIPGINWESRQTLFAGWRTYLARIQKAAQATAGSKDPNGRVSARR